MSYPTHIDPVNKHIRIHKEGCGWVRPKLSDEQTTWFEDFDTVEAAEQFAKEKGFFVDYCTSCFKVE